MVEQALSSKTQALCRHCSDELLPRDLERGFCCAGCEIIFHLLNEQGLERFYQLKPKRLLPQIHYFSRQTDLSWFDEEVTKRPGHLLLAIDGIQCAACVWVIRELVKRFGVARVSINTVLGKLRVDYAPDSFDAKSYLQTLNQLGYATTPFSAKRDGEQRRDHVVLRMGVCVAIAMNTMFLSFCVYLGVRESNPAIFQLFTRINFFLSFLSVLVGGTYFFARAWAGLRKRLFHLDVPISLGIVATFVGSVLAFFRAEERGVYFDTLNIFIALMLAGRYVQQRFLERNRNGFVAQSQALPVSVYRLRPQLEKISVDQITAHDHLLCVPGQLLPVDAEVLSEKPSEWNLDWITGESAPVVYCKGAVVPAGACLLSSTSVELKAEHDYASSRLLAMLELPPSEKQSLFWQRVMQSYVLMVLGAAVAAAGFWAWFEPSRVLTVVVSILVVTCPCSLGLAIPLARSLANRRLLLDGVFLRREELLDKLAELDTIFFDKTGTLTLSTLRVSNPQMLDVLSEHDASVLLSATLSSQHPASRALTQELLRRHLVPLQVQCREVPASGLFIELGEDRYFVGKPHAAQQHNQYAVEFQKNGSVLALVNCEETVLTDAAETMTTLQKMGLKVFQLSGDKADRVAQMAQQLHIPAMHSFAELRPEQKAWYVRHAGGKALMLGDGVNDTFAQQEAFVSGTPVANRHHLAANVDFFFVSGSLLWLARMLQLGKRLRRVTRANLYFTFSYNTIVIGCAFFGLITPLVCAIIMPLSSLFTLTLTANRMRKNLEPT